MAEANSKAPFLRLSRSPFSFASLILTFLVIAAIATSFYLYDQYQKTNKELERLRANPREVAQEESKTLITKVGRLVALPEGEDPTVATITDIEKLKNQPFFARAKNGDKVLIYTQAKKAYLYDPVANKVVEVAPVNIGSPAPSPTEASPEGE